MKKIILAVAVAALAVMAVVSSASANVSHCAAFIPVKTTVTTAKFTALQPKDTVGQFMNVWKHDFTVIINADNTFTGTSIVTDNGGADAWKETVTGSFNAGRTLISFDTTPLNLDLTPMVGGARFKVTDASYNVSVDVVSNYAPNSIQFMISTPVIASVTTSTPGTECAATTVAGSIWYENPGYGLANFAFAGYDGGPSASDKGTGVYTDKSGYYTVKATDVVGLDKTSMQVTMVVTYSKHSAVKVGTQLTLVIHDAPGAPDYLTYEGTNFVAKAGNILVF